MIVNIIGMTVKEIVSVIGGEYKGDPSITINGVVTDSREAYPGALFLAVEGEKVNGHDYIGSAISRGALCALGKYAPLGYEDKVIVVSDPVDALGRLASWHRDKMKYITVAAVTGSVGKTTTKEMIYSVLSEKFATHKTTGNHNNEIGLPMSLLTLDNNYTAAVYEIGMDAPGQIRSLSKIVKPNVAIVTNIGSMHIEHLGSREAIRDAKLEIREGLCDGGVLILNGDEPLLSGIEGAVYVAFENDSADIKITDICQGNNGTSFDLTVRGEKVHSLVIPAIGRHNVMNAAMAYTVGIYFGMSEYEIRRGLMNFSSESMRQRFVNHKDIIILEDCYNAGPESMKASLNALADHCYLNAKRPIAVLGEMRELGTYSDKLHYEVGAYAAGKAKIIFTLGNSKLAEGAKESGKIDPQNVIELGTMEYSKAAAVISSYLEPDDCVMFKASRALKLEGLIEYLKKVY